MSFKKNKYIIIEKAISKELANFICDYFKIKRKVFSFLRDVKYLPNDVSLMGEWGDSQIPGSYSHYSDIAMETLLLRVKPIIEKETNLELIETYSYARIYKKNDELIKHKDRPSCEISATLNLGGDLWAIFLSNEENKEIEVKLNAGDMLVYRGCELEHWRKPFDKEECVQVFLHYNDKNSNFGESNKYDSRPFLGIPGDFKKNK